MRLAARAEGCGSIAEGEFRGSAEETINKYDIYLLYIHIHMHIIHRSYRDRFTYEYDR